ncbi:MAG: M56 family metallopeptidase [Clostridia bacterium]|nr:M56 family metallopeptidase [Clostridia bacterium]
MSETMQIVLLLSLCGTLTAMGLAALRRLLKGKLPHGLFYYLWLLVLLRFLVPVALPLPADLRPQQMQAVPAPDTQLELNSDLIASIQQAQNQLPSGVSDQQWELVIPSDTASRPVIPVNPAPAPASQPLHLRLWDFLCTYFLPIWLAGAVLHFLWFTFSYLLFCQRLKRDSQSLQEHEQALLDNLRGRHAVTVCRSPLAATPMLVGLLRHRIILPDTPITTRQLEYILRHELTHLRRRDLWFKWFTVAATSVHWFNPLMPWIRREIARCCELSCDEAVIGTLDAQQKQWYGETLLALAALNALPRAVPATTLCEEKTQLRERLVSIMHYRKATALILLLSCLLALLIAGCAAVLGPQKPVVEELDTPEEAKSLWIPETTADAPVYHWLYWGDRGEMDMMIEANGLKSYHYNGATLQEEALTKGQQKQNLKSGVLTVGEMETYKSIVDNWISEQLPITNDNYHVVYVTDPDNQHYYLASSQGVWNLSLADHTIQPVTGDWEQGNYQGCFAVYDDSDLSAGEDLHFWTLLPNDGSIPVTAADAFTGKVAVLTQDAPLENAAVETVDEQGNTILMDMALTLKKGTLVYVESHEGSTCTVTLLAGEPPHPRGQLSANLLSTDSELLAQADQVILNNVPAYAAAGSETPQGSRSGVANVELRNALWWKVSLPGGADSFWVKQTDLTWDWPLPEILAPWLPAVSGSAQVYQWRYQEQNGTTMTADLVCMDPEPSKTTAWDYDRTLVAMTEQPVPTIRADQKGGALTVGQLPGILSGIKSWLDANNQAWQQHHWLTLGWITPQLTFETQRSEDSTYLVYNLNSGAVTAMPQSYTGSRAYGAIAVMVMSDHGTDRIYDFILDDTVTPIRPEALSTTDLKAHYLDFAMDWRVDFIPDFDWNSFDGTVSTQDFLMLTWYQSRNMLLEDGSMPAALVEHVMQSQFGIKNIQHESLFKTWNWDAKQEHYRPVPQGVAGDSLFDVVAFNAAERWEDGAPQTVYTVTLRDYAYPFLDYGGSYNDLVDYTLGTDSAYGDNVQFLLDNKGKQLKSGEISSKTALRQMILEGNTSGFTKGREIRLEYYLTETGPRFLYKSQRTFDFTPGEVYENTQFGFRLTLPACWGDDYRIEEQENSVSIDDAWGGTLCTIFVQDVASFGSGENIPVPYRLLGRNGQSVWLMYFASDVQYDPSNHEQTTAYLNMYQDLQFIPFHILDTSSDWQADAQGRILSFLAAQYPEATAPQVQIITADDPSTVATMQMMTTETYSYDLNTGEIAPLRLSVPDSAQLGGLFVRDESGQYRKEWMFLFTRQGPQTSVAAADGLAALASRYPDAEVSQLETFLHDGMDVWQKVVFDTGAQAYTYNYGGALGAVEVEKTDARGTGKLKLGYLPGLLDAIAAWQSGYDTAHNAENYSLALQTNPRFLEIALRQNWAGIAVYDVATGTMCEHIGAYTGTGEYGCVSVLGSAKSPFWLYIIEDSAAYAASLGYDEVRYEHRPDGARGFRFLLARKGDHWGLLDGKGNEILAPETYQLDSILLSTYEEVWPIIPVVRDGLYGAIDYHGNLVIEPAWQEVMMYGYDLPDTVFLRSGYQWYGVRLTYKSYKDVYTYTQMQVSEPFEELHLIPELQAKTAAWLAQEFHRVYDPHYDIQELVISDWDQENGREATFRYTMNYLYYNRDPDIVPYILEAKEKNPSSYETLYKDYLAQKTSNYAFKIRWDGDVPTLYSDVSITGEPEWTPTRMDDYILPWNDSEDTRKVFGGILWNAYLKGELPDGRKVEWNSTEGAAENHFAIADVDGDGREELLLSWTNASMAGHDFLIYGCWRGAVYTQFDQFTSLRFYDNGAIEVDWAHSQGWSGRFWPYYAYRYNAVTDLYEEVGSAEAWDKEVRSQYFPDDIDVDGDGLVYEVCRTGVELFNSKHYDRRRMMDGAAFEEWRQSYLSGAQEVPVELLPLTEENIAVLGAPKPNLPELRPLG